MDEKQSKSYTLSVTYRYLDIVIPGFRASRFERRLEAYEQIVRSAICVSVFHAEHGRLPDKLADVIDAELLDPFDEDEQVIYQAKNNAYSIYSVGEDGEEDDGDDDPKDGDLIIRVGVRE